MRAVLLVVVMLVLAGPAHAATVSVDRRCFKDGCSSSAVFVAAPGERNAVTITHSPSNVALFHDAGAPLKVGWGCVVVDLYTARCPSPSEDVRVWGRLGDGDDSVTVVGVVPLVTAVDGGRGDDRLEGDRAALTGGPGADLLSATGTGGTAFADGDGAVPAPDRYVGGPGLDSISYAGRRTGVRVELGRAGPAGAAGEGDVVSDVEDAIGGEGDDALIGSATSNKLIGGRGSDRLVGLGGVDQLYTERYPPDARPVPSSGRDIVDGGGGRDYIAVTNNPGAAGNVIRCGPERDRVEYTEPHDRIGRDCERLVIGDTVGLVHLRATLPLARAGFLVNRACDCKGSRYRALARGRLVGSARGCACRLTLRLNALGRRWLARRGRLLVTVQYRERLGQILDIYGFRVVLELRHQPAAHPQPG